MHCFCRFAAFAAKNKRQGEAGRAPGFFEVDRPPSAKQGPKAKKTHPRGVRRVLSARTRRASEAKKPALDLQGRSMAQRLLQAAPSTPPPRGFRAAPASGLQLYLTRRRLAAVPPARCGRQIPPGLSTMEEGAEPTKNDVIDMAQARPERKLVENPLTWWGDTPWCMWNFNYGASRAPAP